jgi:PqqD family protein of HPr-rel-A system
LSVLPGIKPRVWRNSAGAAVLLRTWGEEYLAYSELTGQTHLLALFAATVLMLLQERSCSSAELAIRVAEALDLGNDDALLTTVEQTLADFERLGLVEQNPV